MTTLEVCPDVPNSRRRRKKGRIIQKGYHKSEREDARRVAAKAFLSGIILDSNFQPRVHYQRDLEEVNTLIDHNINDVSLSRPMSPASRHSNAFGFPDETVPNNVDVSGEGRLYEIALDNLPQLEHSSPSKLVPSKSLDYSFGTPSQGSHKPVSFSNSVSMIDGQYEKRQGNVLMPVQRRWQTVDNSPAVYYVNTLSGVHAEFLVDSRSVKMMSSGFSACLTFLGPYHSRVILSAAQVPYATYSVLPYRKDEDKFRSAEYPDITLFIDFVKSMTYNIEIESVFIPIAGLTIQNVLVLELTVCPFNLTLMLSSEQQQ